MSALNNEEKQFFVKDLSGRGYTSTLTQEQVEDFDDDNTFNTDDDEESLAEWAMHAEVGDEFTLDTNHFTRIK